MSPARPKFHEAPTEPRLPRLEPARAKAKAAPVTAPAPAPAKEAPAKGTLANRPPANRALAKGAPKEALTEEEAAERRRLLSAPTPAEGTRRSGIRRRSRAPMAREEQVVPRNKDPRRESDD